MRAWFVVAAVAIAMVGCRPPHDVAIPGATSIGVTAVTIVPDGPSVLAYKPLYALLGLRAKTLLAPERPFNDYRLAEDRRRIASWLEMQGRFDATVGDPSLAWDKTQTHVAVTWPVHEGPAYTVASVEIVGAPPEEAAALRGLLAFGPGSRIDLEPYRLQRLELANHLQDRGYGHARVYSRTFVDRTTHTAAWFFYVDAGPKTRVGRITVEGSDDVGAATVLERAGMRVGDAFSTAAARRVEQSLLDTGAFVSVGVITDADIHRVPEYPDSGGVLLPSQVDAEGRIVPRTLPEALDVRIVVVEAPARQLRAELGVEADPTRVDAFAGARVVLRNLFGPLHHLIVEGNVGYGWTFDDQGIADGLYGSALLQYLHSMQTLDLRLTARWRDVLYPAALLREITAGPGLHAVRGDVLFDVDALVRFARTLDLPAIDPATSGSFTSEDDRGAELRASVIADHRDDRIEPTRGWLLGVTGDYAPGGPLGDHRWLQLTGDARGFVGIGARGGPWSLGMRAQAGWVLAADDRGVPLGPRLFGGGPYGMRGFGRDRLSPAACKAGTTCDRVLIGGRSLAEGSVELRYLPFRKQVGAAAFVDAGGAGEQTNAFASGLSLAAGLGGRIRLWYLPIAVDVAYRILDEGDTGAAWDRLLAFVRVGEAF